MLEQPLLEKILSRALKRGGDFAEVFYEDTVSHTLSAEEGEIEEARTGYDQGVGIRVKKGSTISYAFNDEMREEALLETADLVSQALLKEEGGIPSINLTKRAVPSHHVITIYPHQSPLKEKASFVLQGDRGAREQGEEIQQVMAWYIDKRQRVQIARSDGFYVEDERVYTRMGVKAIAQKNGVIQTGSEMAGGFVGLEFFKERDSYEVGRVAAKRALTMLRAKGAPTGPMPVVINNGFGGVLFHEACGHGLEADAIHKKASVFAGRVGEKVAAACVTAIDDATLINEWGSFMVDDEGERAQETVLIKDGILLDYMYDLKEASKGERSSTGNGRRQSYRYAPLPRMTNTFIANGSYKREDIISSIERGFYASQLGGGQVDPATGDFTFSVQEGYRIEKGEIGEPLKGATLIGNGPKALMKIGMIADDLVISSGVCGKDGQSVPASVGQPTLLIEELTVGGTEGREE